MTELEEHLHQLDIFPIMGSAYGKNDFAQINLGITNEQIKDYSRDGLTQYINSTAQSSHAVFCIGGYLEHRNLYAASEHFHSNDESRNIHLAVDIWGPVNTPIYAPLDGQIHSFAYNKAFLDYGYTLILSHKFEEIHFHTLYGHLSSSQFTNWQVGQSVPKGTHIADIGTVDENGGWIPHLHFQIIMDMEGNKGDYPGVCTISKLERYRRNCPDPHLLIKKAPKEF
jgi:murein DD-endopeptidase MepM/ murein hydrolase activator NlpD